MDSVRGAWQFCKPVRAFTLFLLSLVHSAPTFVHRWGLLTLVPETTNKKDLGTHSVPTEDTLPDSIPQFKDKAFNSKNLE